MNPAVVALDVNETLSNLAALAPRLEESGVPAATVQTWFASTLRDGFALTAAGAYAEFADVARATLRSILVGVPSLTADAEEVVDRVVSGMGELPLHDDVRPGLERLHEAGVRLVTLTNSSAAISRKLFERGGIAALIERCMAVEEVGRWKPAPEPYRLAAERCGVSPDQVMLVAVHPWDVDGAKRAGLAAAWINRERGPYPEPFRKPDLTCTDFRELAEMLGA